jgi:hypothetical protein
MVKGLEKFSEHFAGHSNKFILIGGTACAILMEGAGLDFRNTKDLDIVLIIEAIDLGFGKILWDFIKKGDYENIQKSTGEKEFYRFYNPKDESFPYMLELFARNPDLLDIPEGSTLTPVSLDEEISSLSAILLNDEYYNFILDGIKKIDRLNGLPIINTEFLIPLKAKAFLDLTDTKARGGQIDSRDIKKHKNDILRLYNLLTPETRIPLPPTIKNDLLAFIEHIKSDTPALKTFGIADKSFPGVLKDLSDIYQLRGD